MKLACYAHLFGLVVGVFAVGQSKCVVFQPTSSTFPVVSNKKASPVILSSDDWPGVQRASLDFAMDIQRVTGIKPPVINASVTDIAEKSLATMGTSTPVFVGTLGKSSLIESIIKSARLDVSSIRGQWESFISIEVKKPIPGVESAFVIIGSDKRGTIFALYDLSEQFGVSPWYWWADVPTTKHSELFVTSIGCSHGPPTVKYRGIFLNDEQPALQNWAAEKFTNGTGAPLTGSPFNHMFYVNIFELMLRLKANYLWPAIWSSAFAVDDVQNQPLADYYGVVMGTSHQEPMMRSTPIEFSLFGQGDWDYVNNAKNIYNYWLEGAQRAKPFESVFTLGMRGFGDLPLAETTNIDLLEDVITNQTQILETVFGNSSNVENIPQIWTLYQEVEGYYDDGMRVPDYVTLLWTDDLWGNIRRFPTISERNRTGGAGVYYHVDLVGGPRDYKWITTTQIEKIYEQMSIAVERQATRVWVLNVGDLKPYERETEFFITYGWNSSRWSPDNLGEFVTEWAQREFDLSESKASLVVDIVSNLTRFNSRKKPELLNPTTYSLTNYRESDGILNGWSQLQASSTAIYNNLSPEIKPAFFQLVHHAVIASANVANLLITAGLNSIRASQARLSTNLLADTAEQLFEHDFDFEFEYHTMLDGKWDHMMDQTHLGYYYWQQPMTNSMPSITRVQTRKQALAGFMRIVPEGTLGAWPGDNPNQCAQGYNCPPPTISLDSFSHFQDRFIDVAAGGPNPFTFTVSSNVTWLKFSTMKGSISPNSPEQRVFVAVTDWNRLGEGSNTAIITFNATSPKQTQMTVSVMFAAVKNLAPKTFKGFVEGDGVVSIEAGHATRVSPAKGISWKELPRYGRTLSAMTPWPRSDINFTVGEGPALEYDFLNFDTIKGNITVTTYLSPSLNSNGRDAPLALALQIDSTIPQVVYPIPLAPPGTEPPQWGAIDGFVANAIVPIVNKFGNITPGQHTLKIFMMEPMVVVQKIVIDMGGLQPSYLGPPESVNLT